MQEAESQRNMSEPLSIAEKTLPTLLRIWPKYRFHTCTRNMEDEHMEH